MIFWLSIPPFCGWQHLKDHVLVKQRECDVLITSDHDSSTNTISSHAIRNEITFPARELRSPWLSIDLTSVAHAKNFKRIAVIVKAHAVIADAEPIFGRIDVCEP
jgi:hypothetical protein